MTFTGIFLALVILFLIKLWSEPLFWIVVVLQVLTFLNISKSAAFFFVVGLAGLVAILWVFEQFNRKRDPEKWKKIDEESEQRRLARKEESEQKRLARKEEAAIKEDKNRPKVAEKYYREYRDAVRRIPKSEWILMNREEKSNIFKKRERLKSDFFYLPQKTQELIIKKYSIDKTFPNID